MSRTVTGHIRHTNDTPWASVSVIFVLQKGAWTADSLYMPDIQEAVTDESGNFSIDLWTNSESLEPSQYVCNLPWGEKFSFVLSDGDEPVTLPQLRLLANPAPVPPSTTQTMLAAVDPMIASAIATHRTAPNAHSQYATNERVDLLEIAGSSQQRAILTIQGLGQTVFDLDRVPVLPQLSSLFVNGEKVVYGRHYMLDGAVMTWIATDLNLDPLDTVEIYF